MNKFLNPYNYFSNFVLRTPLFSIEYYKELTASDVISNEILKEACCDPLVRESCFLASPTLYFEMEKWINGELEVKKERKIRISILKYLTRMSTRCTPFGLFAGCSLGHFHKLTSIKNTEPNLNQRHTRLDMNYLVALSQEIAKNEKIRDQLLYFPNSSIYTTGNQLRYNEYYYVNSRRRHQTIEVDNSDYLQKVLKKAKAGANIDDFISILIEDDISKMDAKKFIDELLESQLLVSELEPTLSGSEFMLQIMEVLKRLKGTNKEVEFLFNIESYLKEFDISLGNHPKKYISLSNYIKNNPTTFDLNFLFQVDLELKPEENKLSWDIGEKIKEGMALLNKLTLPKIESNLSKFKESFFERYEEREMPLSRVLDIETGIGYIQNGRTGDLNPLVDDLILPPLSDSYSRTKVDQNNIYNILEEKLVSCDKSGSQKIILRDNDFKNLPLNWDDLPDTLSGIIKIIDEGGQEKIHFSGMSGSSAANLIGRFCHGDISLNKFTKNITDLESEMNADKILAEIVHLPEARVGNILMRPKFRKYEIPYLAKSSNDPEHQIPLEDLFISIRNDKIYLRSSKLNKEIIPHLTNAHNFFSSTLPIYQFLCDMQTQNLRGGIYFSFDFLGNNRTFLPRVEYENMILHKAIWKFKKEDLKDLLAIRDSSKLKVEVDKWRIKLKLPQFVLLKDDDKELLVNFSNLTSVEMLLDTVKNKSKFLLSEFLFENDGVVKSEHGYYTHEIIVSVFNERKLQFQNANKNH